MSKKPLPTKFKYLMYVCVAGIVGVITIFLRHIAGLLLGEDNAINYALSIICAYIFGIFLNYLGQAKFTFRVNLNQNLQPHQLAGFIIISLTCSILAALAANLLRYQFGFDHIFGTFSPNISFAFGLLLISFISYNLNAYFIFNKKKNR